MQSFLRRGLVRSGRRALATAAAAAGSRGFRGGYGLGAAAAGGAALAAAALTFRDEPRAECNAFLAPSVDDIPWGPDAPQSIPVFIEVSKMSRMKYEFNHDTGLLELDRVLHSAVFYPHNYGFLPQTLCGDGDPLDVLVMCDGELVPGCIVECRPICYMVMEDEKGMDEKVLAVPIKDPRFKDVKTMGDLPEHTLREIAHFFETYKALEKSKWAKVGGWKGTEDTEQLILETHRTYLAAKAQQALRAK
mmetsp:Transcript_46316/g.144900  ORF Transcript_46316/g.144900 Transcript_46316/m.144900 type:complete len:248 (+) Transcript_46316:95-838(+)|eukprot:CAMPEP_0118872006 /NCGR_PEP_ID=MMETSP1163-20130328/14369_1 /TAXON_ID=124430 /ORGANISM="Phaeomonas parva, Strain CCMP2877" /LENGTH=247 /DNA_ID=CAMNT_0006807159 /DNA_START=24 /DNA_END=767 /DNA_ORIENTATION=-